LTRIGLIADTHDYLDESFIRHFETCNEIWHAGDFGTTTIANRLAAFRPLRGVYGNIDGAGIRGLFPEDLFFQCEQVKVYMTHIGGYPPRYNSRTKPLIQKHRPGGRRQTGLAQNENPDPVCDRRVGYEKL
jgi:uncharacterized protein